MKIVLSLILAMWIASLPTLSVAADPVDLRGKKGVVDPKDLKKYDPKPPKLEKEPPPPPETKKEPDIPPFEVKKSHEGYPGNNPTNE